MNTNWCSNYALIHLQHEAPQTLLQTLKVLKVHSLTTSNQISKLLNSREWAHNLLKHNRTRDQVQANTQQQRQTNTAWSEMVTSTPGVALYCTFPSWFIQCIWDISIPTSHNPYGFIQNFIHSCTFNKHNPMTTSNQMLYLQHDLIYGFRIWLRSTNKTT